MSNTPVVVQGTPVAAPAQQAPASSTIEWGDNQQQQTTGTAEWSGKGEKQEKKCRDPFFSLLAYGNLAAIFAVAMTLGLKAMEDQNISGQNYLGYMYIVLIIGAVAVIISGLMLGVMMRFPSTMIKTALMFVVIMSLVWGILGFVFGNIIMGIFGMIFFAIGVCYARAVWSRIPFATANLVSAIQAVKSNLGVVAFAYFFVLIAFGWSILWAIAFFGAWDATANCDANGFCQLNYGVLFGVMLSYFFGHQIIQNTVHVTTAGTVGTWWFAPEESGCCGAGVRDSFVRATTTSFGSICFGSLLVAIIQALRAIANEARNNGDADIIACIAACILSCLEGLLEYFNKWAFVYVGLYGYSYLEAGKNVITLFKNRGWEAIIADDLVGNTLFMVSVIVGIITGLIGILIEATSNLFEGLLPAGNPAGTSFVMGFVIGLVLCSIFMSTIASAVNAIIVLFAEAPAEFQQNYPELSQQMRDAWISAFPGCM